MVPATQEVAPKTAWAWREAAENKIVPTALQAWEMSETPWVSQKTKKKGKEELRERERKRKKRKEGRKWRKKRKKKKKVLKKERRKRKKAVTKKERKKQQSGAFEAWKYKEREASYLQNTTVTPLEGDISASSQETHDSELGLHPM